MLLKDTSELWEGIARGVGVSSTSVKNHLLLLLQEAQARQTLEHSESVRKAEITKVTIFVFNVSLITYRLHLYFKQKIIELIKIIKMKGHSKL